MAALVFSGSALAQEDDARLVDNSFRGSRSTVDYVLDMLAYPGPWGPRERRFFIQRTIEAGHFEGDRLDYSLDLSDRNQRKLGALFPELRGHLDTADVGEIASRLETAHPEMARISKPYVDRGARFMGIYASPARCIDASDLGSADRPLTPAEWAQALRVLKSGARWEARRPDCDWGLALGSRFVGRLRNRYPGIRFRRTQTGISVAETWRAVRASSGI